MELRNRCGDQSVTESSCLRPSFALRSGRQESSPTQSEGQGRSREARLTFKTGTKDDKGQEQMEGEEQT